jgi:dTDP-4-amino-4,6-dideoxygalactose transaminase
VAERARQLRNLGQRRKGEHVVLGGNDRLDGMQAAFLRVKLPLLAAANAARRAHAVAYRDALDGRVGLLDERPETPCVYHVFPVRVPGRDAVAERIRGLGVDVGVHYCPALQDQPALRGVAIARGDLSRARAWAAEELSLPMFPALELEEIRRSADACLEALGPDRQNGGQRA